MTETVPRRVPRCNTRIELTVEEFLFLDRIPKAGHAVPARFHCELENGHRDGHYAYAQSGEGTIASHASWWMRWTETERAPVEADHCFAKDPEWPEDAEEDDAEVCWLPRDHRGVHEWQMGSDLEFTRTANAVSELGKQRLRTVPKPIGPQLRVHRDHRTLAVRWPDWERWLVIWPPEYPEYAMDRSPGAHVEWRRDLRDGDLDSPEWVDPAFHHDRDLPKLTRTARDELRRALDAVGKTLDAIEVHPWRPRSGRR